MIRDDEHASRGRDFPASITCQYVGLRKPYNTSSVPEDTQGPKCRLKLEKPEDCKESIEYYGKPEEMKEMKYDINNAIEMCRIVRLKNTKSFDVVCDSRHCNGEPLHLGLLGSQTGVVDNWTVISDIKHIGQYLHDHVSSSQFGPSFALLKCEQRQIFQV